MADGGIGRIHPAATAGAALHGRDDHVGEFFKSTFRRRLRPPSLDRFTSGYFDPLEQAAQFVLAVPEFGPFKERIRKQTVELVEDLLPDQLGRVVSIGGSSSVSGWGFASNRSTNLPMYEP